MLKLPRNILLAAVLTLSFGLFTPVLGVAEDGVCFNYYGSYGTGDNFGAYIDTNSKECVKSFCFDIE